MNDEIPVTITITVTASAMPDENALVQIVTDMHQFLEEHGLTIPNGKPYITIDIPDNLTPSA